MALGVLVTTIAGLAAVTERGKDANGADRPVTVSGDSRSVTAASSAPAGASTPSAFPSPSAAVSAARVTGADSCRAARRAVHWYAGWTRHWAAKMGRETAPKATAISRPCPRHQARVLRAKARAYRLRYERWWEYHWHWQAWLPDKWARIGACETGYGKRPGQWTWNSGTYEGAFGFYHGSWDAFVSSADLKAGPYPHAAYLATPRQQYEVALAIWRRYGFSGWGCRGA